MKKQPVLFIPRLTTTYQNKLTNEVNCVIKRPHLSYLCEVSKNKARRMSPRRIKKHDAKVISFVVGKHRN